MWLPFDVDARNRSLATSQQEEILTETYHLVQISFITYSTTYADYILDFEGAIASSLRLRCSGFDKTQVIKINPALQSSVNTSVLEFVPDVILSSQPQPLGQHSKKKTKQPDENMTHSLKRSQHPDQKSPHGRSCSSKAAVTSCSNAQT